MHKPLPSSMFVINDYSNKYNFKGGLPLEISTQPFRKTWLPFFRELSLQLKNQISVIIERKIQKYYEYFYRHDPREPIVYQDEPYFLACNNGICHEIVTNYYRKKMLKINHSRYSYNLISVLAIHKGVSKDIWIRWKSNVPGYEYIHPDDELDLQSGDITFEICSEVPEAVLEEVREIFKGTLWSNMQIYTKEEINAWINFMKDEKNLPMKRGEHKRKEFFVEFAPDCEFPDTTFKLYFPNEVNKELDDKVEEIFAYIIELYNITHKNTIYDVNIAREIYPDCERDCVPVMVDFANCNPKAIKQVIKELESFDLEIIRLVIS